MCYTVCILLSMYLNLSAHFSEYTDSPLACIVCQVGARGEKIAVASILTTVDDGTLLSY